MNSAHYSLKINTNSTTIWWICFCDTNAQNYLWKASFKSSHTLHEVQIKQKFNMFGHENINIYSFGNTAADGCAAWLRLCNMQFRWTIRLDYHPPRTCNSTWSLTLYHAMLIAVRIFLTKYYLTSSYLHGITEEESMKGRQQLCLISSTVDF